MKRKGLIIILFLLIFITAFGGNKREFRGVWIATVGNVDWPSKPGLSVEQQKEEYIRILEDLKKMNMNAVLVQVRPAADRFYATPAYEPWSKYLTGEKGKDPGYDPLDFLIDEAHKRGMEFHAWFNPYRITTTKNEKIPEGHIAKQHPDWVIKYDGKYYYDPGNPQAREFTENVIAEVVKTYNVDGIHMDDYFYPYPVRGKNGKDIPFPDGESYKKYGNGMSLADWRRNNTNLFVRDLSRKIKAVKPFVKFGISPFGVWRNDNVDSTGSATRAGVQNYDDLYADIRTWINNRWIDYVVPQIYWDFNKKVARYDVLVDWWAKEVRGKGVNLYIGQGAYRLGDSKAWSNSDELINQVKYNRKYPEVQGSVFFGYDKIKSNKLNVKTKLKQQVYNNKVLPPKVSSINTQAPDRVKNVAGKGYGDRVELSWEDTPTNSTTYYAIYRATTPQFTDAVLLDTVFKTNGTRYIDSDVTDGRTYYYIVKPVDLTHNEGASSNILKINN